MIGRCLLLASLAVASGCMKKSETYCARHAADDPANCPTPDAGDACQANTDCTDTPATSICDLGSGRCVQCDAVSAQTAACVDSTPVCGTDDTCRGCASHAECPSDVCLPTGRCATPTEVAFVAGEPSPGTSSECTQQAPCDKVQKALALTPQRSYIKITGRVIEPVVIADRMVTLLGAPDAVIANNSDGTTNLEINGTSKVEVYDLRIGNGNNRTLGVELDTAASGSLLLQRVRITENKLGGIVVLNGSLSLQRSTVHENARGGISVGMNAGRFDIRNNFIYSNGSTSGMDASLHGGVLIQSNVSGTLEFNTVAFNESLGNPHRSGISCFGPTNKAGGNLVYWNSDAGVVMDALQIGGTCQTAGSVGLGMGDLGFRNPSPADPDFHLTGATPLNVRDAGGTCRPGNDVDFDGQPRPTDDSCDIGADELDP